MTFEDRVRSPVDPLINMKTKELIEQLLKEDPEGEFDVCVGNEPIIWVSRLPAYHDGRLQVVERDSKNRPVSAKFSSSSCKIQLRTYSIEDAIWDDPDLPVDTSQDISKNTWVEETRAESRKSKLEIDKLMKTLEKE